MNKYKVKPASSTRSAMLKMEQQISDNLSAAREIHTLTFNENTYTLVPLQSNNKNFIVYKNGVDTLFLIFFQEVNKWNPTSHFQLYNVEGVIFEIPAETREITIEVMCKVISSVEEINTK